MKRALLIALLTLAPWALRAVEPESPTVKTDDAPEVTDPDLKDALPAMRQGTDEPVGGYQARSLKGLSGFSLGWDGTTVLGWTSWFSDAWAFKASVGGAYNDSQGGPVVSDLSERVALRRKLAGLGQVGHVFAQLSGGARQKHSFQETQTQKTGPDYVKFDDNDSYTHAYSAGLDLGAELFWPGSRRVSLEASAGLGALWTFTETNTRVDGQPGGFVTATSSSSGRSFEFGSRYNGLTTALNVYF